jgi:uncharacterized protein (TIGR02996 family)
MSDEDDKYLRSLLESPHDPSIRLAYAEWLEKRDDNPRAEFLRLDAQRAKLAREDEIPSHLVARLQELSKGLDPGWLAFVNTLGQPIRPYIDKYDDSRLPFAVPICRRGAIITFDSQFRAASHWEPGLLKDLHRLSTLELGRCFSTPCTMPIEPFVCEVPPSVAAKQGPLTAAEVVKALKVRSFRSQFIENLNATSIPYPGYHPGDPERGLFNDEIHDDSLHQYMFDPKTQEPWGVHGELKRSVVDGQLWYALLHFTPEHTPPGFLMSEYVMLFAIGRSVNGPRLLGGVAFDACHNLCD